MRMNFNFIGQVQIVGHDSSLSMLDQEYVAVWFGVERVIPALLPRHHGDPNPTLGIGPRRVDGTQRLALELIEYHADAAGGIDAKDFIVFQTGNDECTIRGSGVTVGLVNAFAAQFRNAILRYSRDAAAIVRCPNTFLIGSNAFRPCQAVAEDGKVCRTQREIL